MLLAALVAFVVRSNWVSRAAASADAGRPPEDLKLVLRCDSDSACQARNALFRVGHAHGLRVTNLVLRPLADGLRSTWIATLHAVPDEPALRQRLIEDLSEAHGVRQVQLRPAVVSACHPALVGRRAA